MERKLFTRQNLIYIGIFAAAVLLTLAVASLLVNITQRKAEAALTNFITKPIDVDELDPAVWGQNFPYHYERYLLTKLSDTKTPYGGSVPYSKLETYPAMVRIWAGYSFSKDHNEERGHYWTQIDQENTQRVQLVDRPGACINCHSADTPRLIQEMGWEEFNSTPYNDLVDELHYGSSCADCHNPDTMALEITRPAFVNAMELRGVDITQATRQEMRTYVCAQCHVEYYFEGENSILTFPWELGLNIDDISEYYQSYGFKDWTHAETGAPMIKIQHPEFEMWSTGLHAANGVACADCHMPYERVGAIKMSDHWLRSPLTNLEASCQTCHNVPVEELERRVLTAQNRTAELLRAAEDALLDAIDAIKEAREAGATDEDLADALTLHRESSLRWDFVSSENGTGFHSPQEAARILAKSIDLARQAELSASQFLLVANSSD